MAAKKKPPKKEGLPSPASVVQVVEFVSPKGRKYQIIETTETDATDAPPRPTSNPPRKY